MESLQKWIIKNMVITHFGDFIGLRELNIEQLRELSKLTDEAMRIKPVVSKE